MNYALAQENSWIKTSDIEDWWENHTGEKSSPIMKWSQ